MTEAQVFHATSPLACAALAILLSACASLPADPMRIPSAAPADTASTRFGRALANPVAANPGKSGIYPLANGRDAFAARVLLAGYADRTLDVQYYIWRADTTGQLLIEALWRAAERGVRVRMLLDDANVKGLDATLAALDAHPNIEVRLFNPFANRGMRLLEAIGDFSRINHRMHNKVFIADNQAAIVGGRNVGDEYFDAGSPVGFADLDVVAVGPVVKEASNEFDRYWNSESAYPVASLIARAPPEASASLREQWETLRQEPRSHDYVKAVRETELVQRLLEGRLELEWATAQVIADDPGKVLRPASEIEKGLLPRLEHAMGRTMRELDLVSPYFVPGKEGTRELRALVGRGVQVRVLTNALAATDVGPVHAGYSKYREDLLRGGIRIYELKPGANTLKRDNQPGDKGIGSSSSSLHAKTFSADRNRIFVGSFNLDPRSATLNTEMGIVIDSPVLAARLSETLDTAIPLEAYELRLAATGSGLQWVERTAEGEVVHTTEPESSLLRRIWVRFLSILPIEWML
jgi:putative cardiolipin synthase